jgi:hypothetical protein
MLKGGALHSFVYVLQLQMFSFPIWTFNGKFDLKPKYYLIIFFLTTCLLLDGATKLLKFSSWIISIESYYLLNYLLVDSMTYIICYWDDK